MWKLKNAVGLAVLLAACFVTSSDALRCYECGYVEDICGRTDCYNAFNPAYLSPNLGNQNYPSIPETGLGSCEDFTRSNNQLASALQRLGQAQKSNASTSATAYPYCMKSVATVEGQDIILRSYGWFERTDLDGTSQVEYEEIGGVQVRITVSFCNKDGCNGEEKQTVTTAAPPVEDKRIQCYDCAYLEDTCGDDCKKTPGSKYLSEPLSNGQYVGLPDPSLGSCSAYGRSTNDKLAKALQTVKDSYESRANNVSAVAYPYCLKAVAEVDGQEGIIRWYGWVANDTLDGHSESQDQNVGGISVKASVHFCNTNKCNGGSALYVSFSIVLSALIAAICSQM